ncbi:tripartite tricarboxylate transporter substrate binding protein [Verticiella sediminum]|uniref:Tripartite tricarboxylate transporter substrate binding protein n=1 Tax=Verticiella sediminum TaxID=1247510 RepID=A0A556APP3_9BURK|nr:tripartite tricarboxylate transporter substrate binding protein [Verticiella sediminum]TSH94854.1 tripartite tricarboxylate transporter substrate binding protein [Verticiella sediminum]
MKFRCLLSAFALAFAATGQAGAAYPEKPVNLVIPFAPGGLTDTLGRVYADKLSREWQQPVVAENRPGAGTAVGSSYVARAPADGYTLLLSSVGMATNPLLMSNLPYDPKDLEPLALAAVGPNVLYVHPSLPVHSVKELVDYAKESKTGVTFASSGVGASPHLAAELFAMRAGIEIVHVPYKGTGPAMADFLGGQIDAYFDTMQSLHYAQAGRLRAIAVTTPERVQELPDIPTVEESGVAPGVFSGTWFGFFVHKDTPPAIRAELLQAVEAATADEGVRQKTVDMGLVPQFLGEQEFSAFVKDESAKWEEVIRERNITVN